MAEPFFTGDDPKVVSTINDFFLSSGQNLPNHSTAIRGRAKFVRQSLPESPIFRDKQKAFRYAAWLICMAEMLPDEDGQEGITFEEVLDAIRNSG
jgi:hypothetical protein